MKTKWENHYGVMVAVSTEAEEARRKNCLCLHCDESDIDDRAIGCPISSLLYELCRLHNLALTVTRCPKFKPERERP